MFLKDYLQYEKQKKEGKSENQKSRETGKAEKRRSREAKKQGNRNQKTNAQNGELYHLRVPAVADVAPGLRSGSRQLHHLENRGKTGESQRLRNRRKPS